MPTPRHAVVATILLALSVGAVPLEPRPIDIAFVGQFNVPHISGSPDVWFALVPTEDGMTLVQTDVEVSEVSEDCGRNTKIVAPNTKDAFVLVRGAGSLRPGPVTSYFKGRRFIHPAEEVLFRLPSGLGAGFKAYGTVMPAEAETIVTNYEVRMFRGTATQTLATFRQLDWDGLPSLLWVGDLDRDDKLDALFNLQTHYAGNNFALFLSSAAESGNLVKRVAEFNTTGC